MRAYGWAADGTLDPDGNEIEFDATVRSGFGDFRDFDRFCRTDTLDDAGNDVEFDATVIFFFINLRPRVE